MLNFTRKIIKLRREKPALHRGDFILLTKQPREALAYLRQTPEQTILVALNFKDYPVGIAETPPGKWNMLFSTVRASTPANAQNLDLAPYEVLILENE
jgi:glycosidase